MEEATSDGFHSGISTKLSVLPRSWQDIGPATFPSLSDVDLSPYVPHLTILLITVIVSVGLLIEKVVTRGSHTVVDMSDVKTPPSSKKFKKIASEKKNKALENVKPTSELSHTSKKADLGVRRLFTPLRKLKTDAPSVSRQQTSMPPTPESLKSVKHEKKSASPTVNKPLIAAKAPDTLKNVKSSASPKPETSIKPDKLARRTSSRQDLAATPIKDVKKPSKDTELAKLRQESPKKRRTRSRLRSKKTSATSPEIQSSRANKKSGSETESIRKKAPKSEERGSEEKPHHCLSSSEFDSQASYNDSGSDAVSVAESKITKYSLDNNIVVEPVQHPKPAEPASAVTEEGVSVGKTQLALRQSLLSEDSVSPEPDAQSEQPNTEKLDDVSPEAAIGEESDEKPVVEDSVNKQTTLTGDDLIHFAGTPANQTTPIDHNQDHNQNAEIEIPDTAGEKPDNTSTLIAPLAASQDGDEWFTSQSKRKNDTARDTGSLPTSLNLRSTSMAGDVTDIDSNAETSFYKSSTEAEKPLHSNIVLCSPSSEPAIPVTKPTKSFKAMLAKKRARKAAMAASHVSGSNIASEDPSPVISTDAVSETMSPVKAESSYFRNVDLKDTALDTPYETIQDTEATTKTEDNNDNDKIVLPSTAPQEEIPTASDPINNTSVSDPSEADITELDIPISECNQVTNPDLSINPDRSSEINLLSSIEFPISPTIFTTQAPATILQKHAELAQGLVGYKVSDAGAIISDQDKIIGRVTGDLPSMYGMPVTENGGVFSLSGQLAGYVTENFIIASPVPDNENANSTEGVATDNQVRDIIARVGIDRSGNLVDDSGRVVGKVADFSTDNFTPTLSSSSNSSPTEESSTESNTAEQHETANGPSPKIQFTAAKEDEGNPDIYLDVKSTRDGIQISIRIPSGFMRPQEIASK